MTNEIRVCIAEYVTHMQSLTDKVVSIIPGRKYVKVVFGGQYQRSVHSFVDVNTGDLLKAAGWKAPAKGVRFNLVRDMDTVKAVADPYGSYLYIR